MKICDCNESNGLGMPALYKVAIVTLSPDHVGTRRPAPRNHVLRLCAACMELERNVTGGADYREAEQSAIRQQEGYLFARGIRDALRAWAADAFHQQRYADVENYRATQGQPMERARLIVALLKSYGMDCTELGRWLGVSAGHVGVYRGLVTLPLEAQEALERGEMGVRAARSLLWTDRRMA